MKKLDDKQHLTHKSILFFKVNNNYSNRILEASTLSYSAAVGKDSILMTLEKWKCRPFNFIFYTISASYYGHSMPKNLSSYLKILVYEEHLIFNFTLESFIYAWKLFWSRLTIFFIQTNNPLLFLSSSSFCNQGLLLYKSRLSFPFSHQLWSLGPNGWNDAVRLKPVTGLPQGPNSIHFLMLLSYLWSGFVLSLRP